MGKRPTTKGVMDKILSNVTQDGAAAEQGGEAGPGFMRSRVERSGEVLRGERTRKVEYKVDPAVCRLWSRHNRIYERLTEKDCEDLITGFRTVGQKLPAIVRKIDDPESEYQYEIIAGARRHWTASYLKMDLVVEPRELTDLEAFQLADIENRDRKDISDYERGLDYLKALDEYRYYETQGQMAAGLGVTDGWLSKLIGLARTPQAVVDAFPDPRELAVVNGVEIRKYLKEDEGYVLSAAAKITDERDKEAKVLTLREVLKLLNPANKPRTEPAPAVANKVFKNKSGRIAIKRIRKGGKATVTVELDEKSLTLERLDKVLEEYAKDAGLEAG